MQAPTRVQPSWKSVPTDYIMVSISGEWLNSANWPLHNSGSFPGSWNEATNNPDPT
jgi:hypothetical protein